MSEQCALVSAGRTLRSSTALKRKPTETTECAVIRTKRRKYMRIPKGKDITTVNNVEKEKSLESDCPVKPECIECEVPVVLNRNDLTLRDLVITKPVLLCAPIENHVHQLPDNFVRRPVQTFEYVLTCRAEENDLEFSLQVASAEAESTPALTKPGDRDNVPVSNDCSHSFINNILNGYISSKGNELQVSDSLWIDTFKPQKSADIIGNRLVVDQLLLWLKEWEQKCQKENIPVFHNESSNDPDFQYSSDSNDGLANCLLLFGPQGVGKTSLVYALAQQMGFTVLEINPSSLRSGRIVTAQLREATLSHHVEGTSLTDHVNEKNVNTISTKKHCSKEADCEKKPIEKVKKSIADFFLSSQTKNRPVKKISDDDVVEVSKEKSTLTCKENVKNKSSLLNYFSPIGSKENRKQKNTSSVDLSQSFDKCINLSDRSAEGRILKGETVKKPEKSSEKDLTKLDEVKSLSFSSNTIILIDDVDVVFEEDEGFWSTVNMFIRTTKKPVILTASRNLQDVLSNLSSDIEVCHMFPVDSRTIATRINNLCAAKSIDIDVDDILQLVEFCSYDIRRTLLQLQFCCSSYVKTSRGNQSSLQKYLRSCSVLDATQAVNCLHSAKHFVMCDNFPEMISLPLGEKIPMTTVVESNPVKKCSKLDVSWLSDEQDDDEASECDTDTGEDKVTCPRVKASLGHVADVLDSFSFSDVFLKCAAKDVSTTHQGRRRAWNNGLPACVEDSHLMDNFPRNELVAYIYVLSAKLADKELISVLKETSQMDKMSWVKREKFEFDALREKYDLVIPSFTPVQRLNSAALSQDYCSTLRTMHKAIELKKGTNLKRGGRFLHYFDSIGLDVNMDAIKHLCKFSFNG